MRDLSLHILDIMQNSVAAKASQIRVEVTVMAESGLLRISIADNGCGMETELLKSVADPFVTTRTTRRVGLGIPLLKAKAEQSGGSFKAASRRNAGTTIEAGFMISHIDRPPIGDLAGVITDMAAANPDLEIILLLENGIKQFMFNSSEAGKALGEIPLSEFSVIRWLREYIGEGLKEIFGGVLSEIDS